MNDASRRRACTIATMLRSLRAKQGSLSIASRLKEGGLDRYAEHLASVYTNAPPTEAELIRSLNLHAAQQPQCFYTQEEVVAVNRQRLSKRLPVELDETGVLMGERYLILNDEGGVMRLVNAITDAAEAAWNRQGR